MSNTFAIEIANRIRNGRAVGTDYVVTRRPIWQSGIVARFDTREAAESFIAQEGATVAPVHTCSYDIPGDIGTMRHLTGRL